MATLSELDIVALTDHNTAENCPAFFEAAQKQGLVPVAGMELTTSEDIHVVCLFEHLSDAMNFSRHVREHRTLIPNRKDIFGEQLIMNADDEIIGEDEYLLSVATDISVDDAPELVERFGGICYPAHIDRDSNGIIAILGTIPENPHFKCVELHDEEKRQEYEERYGLSGKIFIYSSDSHYLGTIEDKKNYFLLDIDSTDEEEIRRALFEHLR
jgi:hypothetical protein